MNLLLLLPILIPLATAILCQLARRSLRAQRALSLAGAGALLAAAAILVAALRDVGVAAVQVGAWPAPFGITIVADLFSGAMVLVTGVIGLAVAVYSLGSIDRRRESFGYHPLVHILLMGVCGAFLTGDMFNLYVWFEVMLLSSFVLLALGGERGQLEGAIKYVTLNLISSALFLAALGILYGATGTLNMADLVRKAPRVAESGYLTVLSMLFLVAFGIKAAMFPLFFWLPASYHTPPPVISALFAALLTKVGVYAIIRVFTLIFVAEPAYTHSIILALAGLTMVAGVLGAVVQNEFRRILSFHIVSQIGYMLMGLGLFTRAALAGSVFYIIHHIIVKANLFLVSGLVFRIKGSYDLRSIGGVYAAWPLAAMLFMIPAMSLAGMPPLSGFFAKLSLVRAGLEVGQHAIVAVALGVGLLTLLSMTKIWAEVFWAPGPPDAPPDAPLDARIALMIAPIAVLAALTVLMGLGAAPFLEFAHRAAGQLLDPSEYVAAVLGPGGSEGPP